MQNLRGIALVLFSMAAFSIEDAIIKSMTVGIPVGQVLLLLGIGGSLVFGGIAGPSGWRAIVTSLAVPQVAVRAMSEGVAAVSFVTALSLVPLSTVAAVFQATPLAITVGAALFFGERVGWRRWSAVVIGFLGVLMILRPGLEGFRPAAAIVLVTVVMIALRDLLTRRIPDHVASSAVSFHGFFALIVAGAVLLAIGPDPVQPTAPEWAQIAAAVLCGTAGYFAIVSAMRLADASALMPFRYSRLVFSLFIGIAVFAERPDAMTMLGASVILSAAFYTYLRERKIALTAVAG